MIVPAHTSEQESNSSPSTRPLINSPIFLFTNSIHPPTHQYNPSSYPPTHQSSISIYPPTTIQPLPHPPTHLPLYMPTYSCAPPPTFFTYLFTILPLENAQNPHSGKLRKIPVMKPPTFHVHHVRLTLLSHCVISPAPTHPRPQDTMQSLGSL